jgi:hypothetical protein
LKAQFFKGTIPVATDRYLSEKQLQNNSASLQPFFDLDQAKISAPDLTPSPNYFRRLFVFCGRNFRPLATRHANSKLKT